MAFLLLHGLGGDRDQPLSLVGPCLPQDARVLAPDLRAHGASPLVGGPSDFAFDSVTAELVDEVRKRGFDDEPLTVIGISLGAALTLRLFYSAALPIERLVLLRPAFTDQPTPSNLTVFPVIGELLHRHPAERAEKLFRGTGAYRSIREESELGAAGMIEQFRKPDAAARAIRLVEFPRNRAFGPSDPLPPAVPTVIIAAPRDPVHPLSVAELWNRKLPGSTLARLPARDDGLKPYVAATRAAVRAALQ
jgi:pimeloyl-ACP methyl ester carboxylesterase